MMETKKKAKARFREEYKPSKDTTNMTPKQVADALVATLEALEECEKENNDKE